MRNYAKPKGLSSGSWKGGRHPKGGYIVVYAPDHPRAVNGLYVLEHILVVERAIGRFLPARHPVHHFNEDKTDNRPENLVVCEDHAYHKLLHRRQRALTVCGHANWLPCRYCGKHDAPERLYVSPSRRVVHHRECSNEAMKAKTAKLNTNGLSRRSRPLDTPESNSKLAPGQVRELRFLWSQGWTTRALASRYGISPAQSWRAAVGRSYQNFA